MLRIEISFCSTLGCPRVSRTSLLVGHAAATKKVRRSECEALISGFLMQSMQGLQVRRRDDELMVKGRKSTRGCDSEA